MFRLRKAALVALIAFIALAAPRPGEAQLVGWVTPSVGQSYGGQTTENGTSVALSVAVFEWRSWLGAEVDLAHAVQVTDERSGDTSAATAMVNLIVAPPDRRFQPFAVVGGGAIRARACIAGCTTPRTETEFGLDAGGGLQVRVREFLAVRADLRYARMLNHVDGFARTSSGKFDLFRASLGVTLLWIER
jgi:opacity protein-like surface antigen